MVILLVTQKIHQYLERLINNEILIVGSHIESISHFFQCLSILVNLFEIIKKNVHYHGTRFIVLFVFIIFVITFENIFVLNATAMPSDELNINSNISSLCVLYPQNTYIAICIMYKM